MSIYLATSEESGSFIASNTGWKDVREWIESLNGDFPELDKLADGSSDHALNVLRELQHALVSNPPDKETVANTLQEIIEVLENTEDGDPAIITDGTMR